MCSRNLDADGLFHYDSLLDGEDSIDREHFQRVRKITDALAAVKDTVHEQENLRAELLKELDKLKELDRFHNHNRHNISGYPGFQDQRAQPHHATHSEYYGDGNDDNVYGNQHQGVTDPGAEDYISEEMADPDDGPEDMESQLMTLSGVISWLWRPESILAFQEYPVVR